jgi:hypothetical protein
VYCKAALSALEDLLIAVVIAACDVAVIPVASANTDTHSLMNYQTFPSWVSSINWV